MRDWEARLGGYTGASGLVQSFAAGYFVWDLWTALWDFDVHGLGTVVHAVCALGVSVLGYVGSLIFFFFFWGGFLLGFTPVVFISCL